MPFFPYIILLLLFLEINNEYIFVMTHFRHGARAPQRFYNKEKYLDYILEHWETPGELTPAGQRMHYLLGIRNRIRYIVDGKFLKDKFDPHEILVYSSCLNRTIVSAASQLQGLYPQFAQKGGNIYENQTNYSNPKVSVKNKNIEEQIKQLGNYSLPNSMTLIPIRMINNNEKKMRLYSTGKCQEKTKEIQNKNAKNLPTLIDVVDNFNKKFSEKLKDFYGKDNKYDISFIDNFCDAFISNYNERRKMKIIESGFNEAELKEYCFDYELKSFRDWVLGDNEHSIAHLESSKLMDEFIYYMDKRIQNDIKKNKNPDDDVDKNLDDYSNPKMLMISGHDTTVSCFEIFLFVAFDKNINEYYRLPEFASQISFEVVRKEGVKGEKEDDYLVNYNFDDDLIFSIPVPEFKKKVKEHIWDDKKINSFCGYSNEAETSNKNNDKDKNNYNLMQLCLIICSCLVLIFLISTIVLCIRLIKSNKHDSRIYNSLIPSNEEDN